MWNKLPPEYRLAIYEQHHSELIHDAEMARLAHRDSTAFRLRARLGGVLIAAGHALEPRQSRACAAGPEAQTR